MHIAVRLMKKKDLKKLAEIYVRVYKKFDVGERWNQKSAQKLLVYWFRRQPDLAFVAEHHRKVIGAFVAGIKPWWNGNHLVDGEIFVDPDYQKKGIGTLLSKTMFKEALRKYKAKVWIAYTFKKYEFPLKLYKNLGFDEMKEWTIIYGDIKKALKKLEKKM